MQSTTTHPDWFQTVPLTRPIDSQFNIVDYFADFEIDSDATDDIKEILRLSGLFRRSMLTKKRIAIQDNQKVQVYKELIADLSRYYLESDTECGDLNDKIDELDESGCGNYWNLLANYKGFQIFENINGQLLVSQTDGSCFQTQDAFERLYEFNECDREDIAVADAQEFIDAFVLSRSNNELGYDPEISGVIQLSLPI
jgi:hypothetical protein